MGVMTMRELRGLGDPATVVGSAAGSSVTGIASVIQGIVGPLAEAGASAYATYATTDIQKRDLKARQTEVMATLAQRQREVELQAKQAEADRAMAAVSGVGRNQTAQILVAGATVVGTVAGLAWALRKLRKG